MSSTEALRQIEECGASISVTGYTDERGYTEYLIETQLTEPGERHRVQHRLTRFRELHAQIQPGLSLPTAFPVANRLFHTEAVKKERVEKLQAYLRGAAAAAKRQGVGVGPENYFAAKKRGGAAEAAWAALTRFLMLVEDALCQAARKGDEAEVSRLIALGAPLEHRNAVRLAAAAMRAVAEGGARGVAGGGALAGCV